jgi:DNA (cytosine-5)-methyltransferase 1
MGSETDLTVAYCLQGNMIGRKDKNGPAGGGISKNMSYTLTGTDHHAVVVDCRNMRENEKITGTLQANSSGGYSLNCQNTVRVGYIVRRLTPTECERLMGLPDGYTAFGHDGKVISDNKRYQMLGNSVAIPCVAHIMHGICLAKEDDKK